MIDLFKNPREWFVRPLIVKVIGGLAVGLLMLVITQCSFDQFESKVSIAGSSGSNKERKPKAFYSTSWRKIGTKAKYLILGRKPLYEMDVKVALLANTNKNIRIYIPINGSVVSYDFPNATKIEINEDKQQENNSFDVLIKQATPGEVIHFSFKFRHEYGYEALDRNNILVFNGKAQQLDWRNFTEQLDKEKRIGWGKGKTIKYIRF